MTRPRKSTPKARKTVPVSAVIKKARAWFGRDDLVTEPEEIKWTAPSAAIEIGEIVAIEYLSDKYDKIPTVYRHDFTKKRRMMLSLDGSTIIIDPPFTITKRGIEG